MTLLMNCLKNYLFRCTSLFILFIPILFFSRCANEQNNRQTAATTSENESGAQLTSGRNLNIASLYIDANQFTRLDDKKDYNKLVLQMYHVKDSPGLLAVVFPAKNKNAEFDESQMQVLNWRKASIDVSGNDMFLGDQQTKGQGGQNDLKKLISEIDTNNSDPAKPKITFVIFDPVIDPTNNRRFIYKMYGVTSTNPKDDAIKLSAAATSTYETNPSPPAKPD